MTTAGTSNELDVQNEWEENTTHTLCMFCHEPFPKQALLVYLLLFCFFYLGFYSYQISSTFLWTVRSFIAAGKDYLRKAFSDPTLYISSFILPKAGSPIFAALLTNVFPPVRSLSLFVLDRKVILLKWSTVFFFAHDFATLKIRLIVTHDSIWTF